MARINWNEQIEIIKEAGLAGTPIAQIAEQFGVTKQRMHQVVAELIPDWKDKYGWAVRRKAKAEQYQRKWGDREDSDLYNVQRTKYRAKKSNATKTGWTWTIEFGDLTWPTHCPILGMELDWFAESRQENSPSFDRVNPSLGYETGNVQIISWRANRIKNDGTAEEHEKIAQYLKTLKTS